VLLGVELLGEEVGVTVADAKMGAVGLAVSVTCVGLLGAFEGTVDSFVAGTTEKTWEGEADGRCEGA
jgi:hypothetical protein